MAGSLAVSLALAGSSCEAAPWLGLRVKTVLRTASKPLIGGTDILSRPGLVRHGADSGHGCRHHPPAGMRGREQASRPSAAILVGEEAETGGAAARHAREQRARQRRDGCQNLAYDGLDAPCRRF